MDLVRQEAAPRAGGVQPGADGVPVLVAEPDLPWVAPPDPVIRPWRGTLESLPGATLAQQWHRAARERVTDVSGIGTVTSWVNVTEVDGPLVSFR